MLMDFAQTPRRFGAPRGGWHARGRPPHMYAPQRGRFLQPDPIGYGDGVNWYGYVGGDPVNGSDPSGLQCELGQEDTNNDGCKNIVVTGPKPSPSVSLVNGGGGLNYGTGNCTLTAIPMLCNSDGGGSDIIVTAIRKPPAALVNGALLPKVQQPKKTTCDLVAAQPGRVFVDFGSASFVAGIGVSGSVGVFTNISTGSSGFFYTGGGNLGFEAGAGLSGGFYASAGDLRGINANINVSGGVSGSANFSKDGRFVGGSAGQSARLGASVSISNTTFFGCVLQGN